MTRPARLFSVTGLALVAITLTACGSGSSTAPLAMPNHGLALLGADSGGEPFAGDACNMLNDAYPWVQTLAQDNSLSNGAATGNAGWTSESYTSSNGAWSNARMMCISRTGVSNGQRPQDFASLLKALDDGANQQDLARLAGAQKLVISTSSNPVFIDYHTPIPAAGTKNTAYIFSGGDNILVFDIPGGPAPSSAVSAVATALGKVTSPGYSTIQASSGN